MRCGVPSVGHARRIARRGERGARIRCGVPSAGYALRTQVLREDWRHSLWQVAWPRQASVGPLAFDEDAREHGLQTLGNVAVGEADDTVSLLVQPLTADGVVFLLQGMNAAIDLDDETVRWAAEIDDEAADRMLPTELEAGEPLSAEAGPELRFRRCL